MSPVSKSTDDAVASAHFLIEFSLKNARTVLEYNTFSGVDPVTTWEQIKDIELQMFAGCNALSTLFGYGLEISDRMRQARAEFDAMTSALLEPASPADAPEGV